ncbi:hypothetical protein VIC_001345 [Vibrio coralliilyticus ATCC BAA-450]|nr:hypothetical protein VIC_001345 [Vibrio coralliilyticus ATCC BAA-450]
MKQRQCLLDIIRGASVPMSLLAVRSLTALDHAFVLYQ